MTPSEPAAPRTPRASRGTLTGWALLTIAVAGSVASLAGCGRAPGQAGTAAPSVASAPDLTEPVFKVAKTDDEWRAILTPEQFEVTRRQGTEAPFTGQYWDHKEQGTYKCVCCGATLFVSDTKYDSGCGWPSFFAPADPKNLRTREDPKFGIVRIEVRCNHCGAHLGHVFDDGPQPTGQRYCMNSAALKFEKQPAEAP
jgi:methionine-R-sulfoxide reductase